MRRRAIFQLAVAAALVAGCDSAPGGTDQGALQGPRRDLTLQQLPAGAAAVASPIEIPQSEPERSAGRPRRARQPAVKSVSRRETRDTTPSSEAAAPAAPEPAASAPAPAAPAPALPSNSRELAPGQTVTIIPASSGPSVAAEPGDETPSRAGRAIMRGHGGTCRPRPRGAL